MAQLAALSHEFGMTAGFHNHSGNYVGASATWDVREILAGIDPRDAGYYFDVCHATAEGGVYGGELAMRVAGPRAERGAREGVQWGEEQVALGALGEGVGQWSTRSAPR